MRTAVCAIALLILTSASAPPPADFPEAIITNGLIEAHLYLPDPEVGYYRGARFDWSGVVSRLTFQEHNYFGQWFEQYSPTLHDAIMGPVDAFDPIGFAEAGPMEEFLKVGIGTLQKPDDKPYYYATPYKILDHGHWTIETKKDQVKFIHQHAWKDFGYVYTKVVRLEPGKAVMTLHHVLKNTGTRAIETSVYNHNFFVIDRQPTGPDFNVTFAFPLSGECKSPAGIGELQGNRIAYKRVLARGETLLFVPLTGFGSTATDNRVTIENHASRAGVRISCDLPIERLVYWSASTTVCPEPFSRITVAPGAEMGWDNTYEFYSLTEKKK